MAEVWVLGNGEVSLTKPLDWQEPKWVTQYNSYDESKQKQHIRSAILYAKYFGKKK